LPLMSSSSEWLERDKRSFASHILRSEGFRTRLNLSRRMEARDTIKISSEIAGQLDITASTAA
jgi:hypothetical protein